MGLLTLITFGHACLLLLVINKTYHQKYRRAGKNTVFTPITAEVGQQAAELRVLYNLKLPDALQIAVAMTAGCEAFLTNDARLKRVSELRLLVLGEFEM